MILIDKHARTLHQAQGAETAEEIIDVLTAISVVAKRMAKKLAQLESELTEMEEKHINDKQSEISEDAD